MRRQHWERSVTPAYRIYELFARGHITGPAVILIRENDVDVIQSVESSVARRDIEILEGARVVARLRRSG